MFICCFCACVCVRSGGCAAAWLVGERHTLVRVRAAVAGSQRLVGGIVGERRMPSENKPTQSVVGPHPARSRATRRKCPFSEAEGHISFSRLIDKRKL